MEIALTRPQPIRVAKVGSVGIKAAIAATTLYALCALPSAIYLAHPAIRAWQHESRSRDVFLSKSLARLRQEQQALQAEALAVESPTAPFTALQEELERAKKELVGCQQKLKGSQKRYQRLDTLFHRVTGNKILACAQQQQRDDEQYMALASQHVRDLEQALEQCHADATN